MRNIGPRDSKPEKYVRSVVHGMGYRFRLHRKDLPGTPDIVLSRHRKVIFMHSCFFHGHKRCKRAALPATNRTFWKKKIEGNIKRDKSNYRKLKRIGWEYLVIWQCRIKNHRGEKLRSKIGRFLGGGK